MRELVLGARLTLAGGRTGLARTLITALGVGLGVAALLLAASLPAIHEAQQDRRGARTAIEGSGALLVGNTLTEFQGRDVHGQLLQAERAGAPVPPGLARLPRPGEVYVSPALGELLDTREGQRVLAPRLPGRVVGEVGPDGLLGPHELGFYAGARELVAGGPVQRIERFGTTEPGAPLDPALVLLVVIALVALLIPVAVVVGAAVRTGGEDRDRRLAALRLIGADQAMARRIAAGEAIVAAACGVLVGGALFAVARLLVERIELQGFSVYASDVEPAPLLAMLVVLGVPAVAVGVSLVALKRVVAEPLGVVRRAGASRPRRLWWRLVLPLVGLALLAQVSMQDADDVGTMPLAVGIIALLIGVTALLPWLVERVVARLGAGAVAWQLAVRRLQLDPGGAARAVSGIAVAVAGAIALQMVFYGAQARFQEETGADPSKAQLYVTRDAPVETAEQLAARLSAVPGVSSVTALTEYDGHVYVAPCETLRELAGTCEAGRKEVRDPAGALRDGTYTTEAPDGEPLAVTAYVRAEPGAYDGVRTVAAQLDPLLQVLAVERIATDAQFAIMRRAMFAGAAIVMALIGFSLLLTALDQLRERRRLLAVLVAFGTRRSTLSWSLLWQSALPVGLGLAVAVCTGLGLGAVLLSVIDTGVRVAWLDVLGMVAVAATVVLLVTAASLPVLFRTMRPEGLRTE